MADSPPVRPTSLSRPLTDSPARAERRLMKIIIGLMALTILGFAIFLLTPVTQGQKSQLDEATPVTKGAPTEQEQAFSNEFAKHYPDRQRIKLSEFMPDVKEFGIGLDGPGNAVDIPEARESRVDQIFTDLTCKSDLAIVGRPTSKASHLASDETFIFTQYEIAIEDVLIDNKGVGRGNSILVAWPGGKIKLENRIIAADDFNYAQLKTSSKYVLFLRYVPEANGYVPTRTESDYEIDSETLRRNSPGHFGEKGEKLEIRSFMSRIQNKLTNKCERN